MRPLLPDWARLAPGALFGPLEGWAQGHFAQIHMLEGTTVILRRDALDRLRAEGFQHLKAVRTGLRFRRKDAPELWELDLELQGLFHPDCLPPGTVEPCAGCGCYRFSLPARPLLDRGSLPEHLDVFRLRHFANLFVVSERFADTLRRLGFEEFALRELPVR